MRMFRRIVIIGGAGIGGAAALAALQIRVGALFGVGGELDAFFVGAALPSVLLAIAAAAISSLVIPRLPTGDPAGTAHAAGRMAVRAVIVGTGIAVVVVALAPLIVALIGPGLDASVADRATSVLRIYALSIPGTAAAFVYASYGYVSGRIWTSGASTAIYALTWLLLLFLPAFNDDVLSVALAGVIATGVQVLSAYAFSSHGLPRPRPVFRGLPISRDGVAAISAVAGAAIVARTGLLLDPLFGSFLPVGSVSELSYAARIAALAILVCGQGVAFSLLIAGREATVESRHESGIGLVAPLLFATAAAIVILVAATSLTELILVRGELTDADAQQIADLLRIWSPSVIAFALIWALEAILYSERRTGEVLTRALAGLLVNIAASVVFVLALGIDGRPIGVLAGASAQLVLLAVLFWGDERFEVLRTAETWRLLSLNAVLIGAAAGGLYGLGVALSVPEPAAVAAVFAAAAISLAMLRGFAKSHVPEIALREPAGGMP